jgi:hypothetical protein
MVFTIHLFSWKDLRNAETAFRQSGGKSVSDQAPSSCLRFAADDCKTHEGKLLRITIEKA